MPAASLKAKLAGDHAQYCSLNFAVSPKCRGGDLFCVWGSLSAVVSGLPLKTWVFCFILFLIKTEEYTIVLLLMKKKAYLSLHQDTLFHSQGHHPFP